MRITDETAVPAQVMYLRVVSAVSGPRGVHTARNLKGVAGRKSWRCWEALWGESSAAGISTRGLQVARAVVNEGSLAQAGWNSPRRKSGRHKFDCCESNGQTGGESRRVSRQKTNCDVCTARYVQSRLACKTGSIRWRKLPDESHGLAVAD